MEKGDIIILRLHLKYLVTTGKVQRAIQWGRSLKSQSQDESCYEVAQLLIQKKNFVEAERVAKGISNTTQRDFFLSSLASALIGSGKLEEAWNVAINIKNLDKRHPSLLMILTRCLGNEEKLKFAVDMVKNIRNPHDQDVCKGRIFRFLEDKGRLEELKEYPDILDDGLKNKCETLIGQNDCKAAERVANNILNTKMRDEVWERFADALIQSGDLKEAERVAKSISDTNQRDEVWERLADALIQSGKLEEAERVAKGISNTEIRDEALQNICIVLCRLFGNLEETERVAKSISDTQMRDSGLQNVCIALCRSGHREEAERVANGISDTQMRDLNLKSTRI